MKSVQIFIDNFEPISHVVPIFPLLTLDWIDERNVFRIGTQNMLSKTAFTIMLQRSGFAIADEPLPNNIKSSVRLISSFLVF